MLAEQLRAARAALVGALASAARWEAAATDATDASGLDDERFRRKAEAEVALARSEVTRFERLLEGKPEYPRVVPEAPRPNFS